MSRKRGGESKVRGDATEVVKFIEDPLDKQLRMLRQRNKDAESASPESETGVAAQEPVPNETAVVVGPNLTRKLRNAAVSSTVLPTAVADEAEKTNTTVHSGKRGAAAETKPLESIVMCSTKARDEIKEWIYWRLNRNNTDRKAPEFCVRDANVLLIIGKSGTGKRTLVKYVLNEINGELKSKAGVTHKAKKAATSDEPVALSATSSLLRLELVDTHAVDSLQGLLRLSEDAVCLNRLQTEAVEKVPVWLFAGVDGYLMTEKLDMVDESAAQSGFVPASVALTRLLRIWGCIDTAAWERTRFKNIPPVILTAQSLLEVEKMGLSSKCIPKIFMASRADSGIVTIRRWCQTTPLFSRLDSTERNAVCNRFTGDLRRTLCELELLRDSTNRASRNPESVDNRCGITLTPPSEMLFPTVARCVYQTLSAFVWGAAKTVCTWGRGASGIETMNFTTANVRLACVRARETLATLRVATLISVLREYESTLNASLVGSTGDLDNIERYCLAAVKASMRAGNTPVASSKDDTEFLSVVAMVHRHFKEIRALIGGDVEKVIEFCRFDIAGELNNVLRRRVLEETLAVYLAARKYGCVDLQHLLLFGGLHEHDIPIVRDLIQAHAGMEGSEPIILQDVKKLLQGRGEEYALSRSHAEYRVDIGAAPGEVLVHLRREKRKEDTAAASRLADVFFNTPSDAVEEILSLDFEQVARGSFTMPGFAAGSWEPQTRGEEVMAQRKSAREATSRWFPGKYVGQVKDVEQVPGAYNVVFYDEAQGVSMSKTLQAVQTSGVVLNAGSDQVRVDACTSFAGVEKMLWLYSYSGWHEIADTKDAFLKNVLEISECWSFVSGFDFKKLAASGDVLRWLIIHKLRLERATARTLTVVWPVVAAPTLKVQQAQLTVAEKWGGRQRPDMSRDAAPPAENGMYSRAEKSQSLRKLRLGCMETAMHKPLDVLDTLGLLRAKTTIYIAPAVVAAAKSAAVARHAFLLSDNEFFETKTAMVEEECALCRLKGKGVALCVCTFKAPALTESDPTTDDSKKSDSEKAEDVRKTQEFSFYAVHGFKKEFLPADFHYDYSNPSLNNRMKILKDVDGTLRASVKTHGQRILDSNPSISLGAFREFFDCFSKTDTTSAFRFRLPESLSERRDDVLLKTHLSSFIYALTEEVYFSWHAERGDDPGEICPVFDPIVLVSGKPSAARAILHYENGVCVRCLASHDTAECPPATASFLRLRETKRRRLGNEDEDVCLQSPGVFKKWLRNGKLHRDNDLPASIEHNERGTTLSYLREGIPYRYAASFPHVWHQLKEKVCVCVGKDTQCTCESRAAGDQYVWLDSDFKPHRNHDLPAVIGPGRFKQWYSHGKLHRQAAIGPAQITEDGTATYYEHDQQVAF